MRRTCPSKPWLRWIASTIAVLMLTMSFSGYASARIIFQDDVTSDIDSEGLILNADDGGDEDVLLQFGNDTSDATITFDDGLSDLIYAGAGMDWSAVDQFRIREDADPASNAACDFKGELIYDTTDDELQICTATGVAGAATWTSVDTTAGSATLQDVYDNETANDREILVNGGDDEAVEIRAAAAGDDLFELQANGGSVLIGFDDLGGNTIDIDSLIVDWDATGAFALDSSTSVHIGGGAASEFVTTAGDITVDSQAGSVLVDGGEAVADAIQIQATNAAGGIDVDAGTGGIAIDTSDGGAISIDAIGAPSNISLASTANADDLTVEVTGANDASLVLQSAGTNVNDAIIINASAGGLDINIDDNITIDSTNQGISLDGAAASNFTTSAGAITVSGGDGINIDGTGQEVDITSTGALVDINSATFTLDTTSSFSIDGAGTASNISLASDGAADDLTVEVTGANDASLVLQSAGTGTDAIDINATAGGIDIDAATASAFTTAAGALTLDGADGVNIAGNAAEVDITTTDAVDINSGAFTLDGSTVSVDGTDNSNFTITTNDAADKTLTLSATNAGAGAGYVTIGSDTWNISSAGVATGFTGITSTGIIDFSGSSRLALHQGGANPAPCTEGDIFYNTTDNTTYVCTATGNPGTWTSLAGSATPDFEAVYGADADNTLTASGTFDVDATGAVGIDSDAGLTLGGSSIGLTADGGILALTGDGTNDIDILNTGAAIDIGSATYTLDTTSSFSIDGAAASNITTSAGDLTLSATTNSVVVNGAEAVADAVQITASNAAGGIDINAGTGGVAVDSTGAISLDGAAASNFTTSSGAITVDGASGVNIAGNAAEVDITTTGAVDINSGAFTLDGSTVSVDGTDDANFTVTANDAADKTLTLSATNAGAGAGVVSITANDVVINSDTWDVSAAGVGSGFTGLTSTGVVNLSGTSSFRIREVADEAAAACTTVNEIVLDTTENVLYVCTTIGTPGTWSVTTTNSETLHWYPEYSEVIYDKTNAEGTLETIDDATEGNAYQWTTGKNGDQDVIMIIRTQLPDDFDDPNDLDLRFKTAVNDVGENAVGVELYNITNSTQCAIDNDDDADNITNNAWSTLTLTEAAIETGCTGASALDAGDIIEIRIYMLTTKDDGAYVGFVELDYDN